MIAWVWLGNLHVPVIFTFGADVYPSHEEVILTPLTVLFVLSVIVAVAVAVGAVILNVGIVEQLPSKTNEVTTLFSILVFTESPPSHFPPVLVIRGGNS